MTQPTLSQDAILGGRIRLWQPTQGYRVAIDPIFLAAAIPAQTGDTVLDIGTGVGAAALCLAYRVPGCRIVGLEVQRDLVRIAAQNIQDNQLREWVEVLHGDLTQPPPRLAPSTYSHVMANPPFYDAADNTLSPIPNKSMSHTFSDGANNLKAWVNFAHLMVRPKGTLTFIYPVERIESLIALLAPKVGCLAFYPLWTSETRGAKRVLVRGIKSTQGPTRFSRGLILHTATGSYTPEAEAVLRHGGPVLF